MYCKYCENEINPDDVICPVCGKQVKSIEINGEYIDIDSETDKSNVSAKDLGKSVLRYLLTKQEHLRL